MPPLFPLAVLAGPDPFAIAGFWLLRVSPDNTSLLPDAERLRTAARGKPGQLILLLAPGTSRLRFAFEIISLTDCIVMHEDKALAAIGRGVNKAKQDRLLLGL